MNTQQIIGSVLTGSLKLSIGCRQSRTLKDATAKVSKDLNAVTAAGDPTGSINVNVKLWKGAPTVMKLQKKFTEISHGFDAVTLPWSKGIRIFRANQTPTITSMVNTMLAESDSIIDEIAKDYTAEVESALMAAGSEVTIEDYPETADEFRKAIVRRLDVQPLGESNRIVQMVGTGLGHKLAEQYEQQLKESIGQAQQEAANRLGEILDRFMIVCDPNKDRTRVTDVLFSDMLEVTSGISSVLLWPNPQLEDLATKIKQRLSLFNKEEISKNKNGERAAAYREASAMKSMLNNIPIV